MLHSAVVLFVIEIVASLLGFADIATGAGALAKLLFVSFAIVSVSGFVRGLVRDRLRPTREPPAESPVRQPT